jgi:hypothetical protein
MTRKAMPTPRPDDRVVSAAVGSREPTQRRFSSGRECWVFSVRGPEDLPGYHPELIASALGPGEPLRYLLYSPLYEASGGPFGVFGTSASHAVAVTSTRIVVSRDPHRDGVSPAARAIPLDCVLSIRIGEALVLGWLVVRFAENGSVQSETVLFRSSGRRHFENAVRATRSGELAPSAPNPAPQWRTVDSASPPYLRDALPGVVLGGERPTIVLRSSERWRTRSGRRAYPRCLSPSAVAVLSDQALFLLESERPSRPGGLAFGVDASIIERKAIRACRVETDVVCGHRLARLVAEIGTSPCTERVEVPFDEPFEGAARCAVAMLGRPDAGVP